MTGIKDMDLTRHLHWAEHLRGLRPNTIRTRRAVLNRLRVVIDTPLREAHIGHLMAWETEVVSGLSPESRRAYVGHVHSFYRWAMSAGIVTDDPSVMLTNPKIPKPLPRPIGEEDLRLAIDAASPKLAAMLTLMADAGLRCMEVAHLQWQDIELGDEAWLTIRDGKGGKDRQVPVGATVIQALRRFGWKQRGYVFLGHNGRPIKEASVSVIANNHLARLGIPFTAHKLRARYATQAARVADLTLVAELLGWSSLKTAQHYVKPDRQRSADVVAAMDNLANPA